MRLEDAWEFKKNYPGVLEIPPAQEIEELMVGDLVHLVLQKNVLLVLITSVDHKAGTFKGKTQEGTEVFFEDRHIFSTDEIIGEPEDEFS